jgi:formylglycine-generating enzyme required for sulfatase activity
LNQTEVTQSEYDVCVKAKACAAPAGFNPVARPRHPVGNVTWEAANTFCTWSGKRLPTEAEWEKAARGPGSTIYPWGDEAPKDCSLTQYKACAPADSIAVNQLVGTSGYGIEDMAGNVAEWVSDFYSANYYAGAPATDPPGPGSGPHLRRGGGFNSDPPALRTSARASGDAAAASTGFRCARSL